MARLLSRLRASLPPEQAVQEGFARTRFERLRLEGFPRGIDNLHIDVALGPSISRAAEIYIAALVRENLQRIWRQPADTRSDSIGEGFRRVLLDLHNAVVKQARSSHRLERVQLFQVAVLRLLLDLTDAELTRVRNDLEDARHKADRGVDGRGLQIHHQSSVLARNVGHVRYRVARHAVRDLMRLEHESLRKLRKSVLGRSWPVAETLLTNPILQLDGFGALGDFSRIYPAVLYAEDDARRAGLCLLDVLGDWLPQSARIATGNGTVAAGTVAAARGDKAGSLGLIATERRVRLLVSEGELADWSANWLDLPVNATALLGGAEVAWPQPFHWHHPRIATLQLALNRRFERALRDAQLVRAVRASYALSAIYPTLGLQDAETLVYEYLKGDLGKREMTRRLAGVDGVSNAVQLLRRIDQLNREHARNPAYGRRQTLARFAGDVLRLRRDLKHAWRMFRAMDSIRLLNDEREQALSLANNTLQVFCLDDLALDAQGNVVGHVIIRTEVRGSDRITGEMRRRNLNPAAHFSRYFYDPITRLLDPFGAQKVAVEGDALMLSILEHGGEAADRLAVARACCLATRILHLVDTMNAEHRRIGLPQIELGIGISYADEAPTYLYDQSRRVTISPAINRARSLASCNTLLRETCPQPGHRGLCVALPMQGDERDATLVRYNVNGIELEPAAFTRLHVEVSLRKLTMRRRGSLRSATLYAGSCTDTNGVAHGLVIRERPVKLWIGNQLLEKNDEGRRFYEVVADPQLTARVAARLAEASSETASAMGHSD